MNASNVAGPAVDLGAAAGDVGDEVAGVGERGAVVLAQSSGAGREVTGRIASSPDRAYGTTIVRTSKEGGGRAGAFFRMSRPRARGSWRPRP